MGTVWLAERADEAFRKEAAVKVINHDVVRPDLVRRFVRERQILADLEHANICRLLDGGTAPDGQPYLVMELVDGDPLDGYFDQRDANPSTILGVFVKLCDALHYAHVRGVVHRDLKPSNVMVTAGGEPKVLDFGIARLRAPPQLALTQTGEMALTPSYASPEQWHSEEIGPASDVFSMGVMLFELLAGSLPPLPGLKGIDEGPLVDKGHGEGLRALVLRAVHTDPQERYPSMAAFAEALRQYLSGERDATRPRVQEPSRSGGLPQGTVTLFFSDIEGSTALLYKVRGAYPGMLTTHRNVLRKAFSQWMGHEVDTQGDAFFAVFVRPEDAVRAAIQVQRGLATTRWPEEAELRVRIGLHLGTPMLTEAGYVGIDVHRGARICAAGHGGQILVSSTLQPHIDDLPEDVSVTSLGSHQLKDMEGAEQLYQIIGEGLPKIERPLRAASRRKTNLPTPVSTFVGREPEVSRLRSLLCEGEHRLVSLTGPGGTGKTRLAVQVGNQCLAEFPDGIHYVALSSLVDPSLVATTIAQVLRVPEVPGRTIIESIEARLSTEHALLVLDNFEHVMSAAPMVVDLLRGCPRLKVLVTSREVLGVRGEHELQVPVLGLPSDGPQGPGALRLADSVRLLIERARDHRPGFDVRDDNASAIATICRQMDGLPLAIELVSSYLRILSPQALAERLSRPLDLPSMSGGRDLASRQRTLRAAIDWSYDLLTPEEQRLFRWLAVFSGGFTIESAGEVCGGEAADLDIFVGLGSLANKSLLTLDVENERRMAMLRTIREYALERLGRTPDAEVARQRHAEHFVALAEAAQPELLGRRQRVWITRLQQNNDNLRSALQWAIEAGEAGLAGRLIDALLWFWVPQTHFEEGRASTERALGAVRGSGNTELLARVLNAAGFLAIFTVDYETAAASFSEALRLFEQIDAKVDVALLTTNVGITMGGYAPREGFAMLEKGVKLARATGNTLATGITLIALGEAARMQGDDDLAASCYEESLDLLRRAGNMFWIGYVLQNLAHVHLHRKQPERAAELLDEALDVAIEYGYRMVVLLYLAAMAGVAVQVGRARDAARLMGTVDCVLTAMSTDFQPSDQVERKTNSAAARRELGDGAYREAFEYGATMEIPEGVALARSIRDELTSHTEVTGSDRGRRSP